MDTEQPNLKQNKVLTDRDQVAGKKTKSERVTKERGFQKTTLCRKHQSLKAFLSAIQFGAKKIVPLVRAFWKRQRT